MSTDPENAAFKDTMDQAILKMVSMAQRPTIIASESGANSFETGTLASGKIQWKLKLYAQPGDDPYEFVEAAAAITEQVYSYYLDHKPGEPLPRLSLQRAAKQS